MGFWITLHLFDDKNFYKQIVPTLRGESGSFKSEYLDFMKSHIAGSIIHFSEEQKEALLATSIQNVKDIANGFDHTFKRHNLYNLIDREDKRRQFLNEHPGYYDFVKFFEYYVFKKCADFFPHLALGKSGLSAKLNVKQNSVAASCISVLENWETLFCAEATGIISWASGEDIELLYHDQNNLHSDNENFLNDFRAMLDVAYQDKLGMIMGVDMRQEILEQLPSFKLISRDKWKTLQIGGAIFHR